jgi:hypothetical protein
MKAWDLVKPRLQAGTALELDQLFLAREPDRAGAEIGTLLELDPTETARLVQALAADRPERTGAVFAEVYDAPQLGWDADKWQTFDEICGAQLAAYGYSRTSSYFASDDEKLRMRRI